MNVERDISLFKNDTNYLKILLSFEISLLCMLFSDCSS